MIMRKHFRAIGMKLCTALLSISLFTGCSIATRVSEEMNPKEQPASPVIQDVYEQSVQKDVYSTGGRSGQRLIPMPSLESQDPLLNSAQ